MKLTRPLAFKVYGTPAPQGSLRTIGNGKARRLINDNPKTGPWRERVAKGGRALMAHHHYPEPIDGPITVTVTTTLQRPVSIKPHKRWWPYLQSPGHGDVDKLARTVLDALVDARVIANDAQVVELVAVKAYRDTPTAPDRLHRPGAVIRIYPTEQPDDQPTLDTQAERTVE
jgi:Holliday junction resolvase RusA-like endonuclease